MTVQQSRSAWTHGQIVELITSCDGMADWSDLSELLSRPFGGEIKPSWEYACHAAAASGGTWESGLPAAAAVLCLHYSIHLVDDVLDEDPAGLQHRLGHGPVFNMATACQAVAGLCLARADAEAGVAADLHLQLHETVVDTGYGQFLDASDPVDEDGYWVAVRAKTPPLFRCALFMGARLAGASRRQALETAELGRFLGEIAQINDDLGDAVERPARPDWERRGGNLAILFAASAEHPEQARFLNLAEQLRAGSGDSATLEEAQDILIRSGAVSYCVHRLVDSYRQGLARLAQLALAERRWLVELFEYQLEPLRRLLDRLGIDGAELELGSTS